MKYDFQPASEGFSEGSNLLRALSPADLDVLRPAVRVGHLPSGYVLHEPGSLVEYCYFPCHHAVASYFVMLESGRAVETSLIGREGALGGLVSQGRLPAFARASVMQEGMFCRIRLADLDAVEREAPPIRKLFARYADCLVAQILQSVACNASHTIEQRAAKWLVASVDRTGATEVTITQEQLASMLGVGRSYASRVIQRLKAAGVLRTRRGRIIVTDVDGMQDRACGCNEMVRQHFDAVLRGVYPNGAD